MATGTLREPPKISNAAPEFVDEQIERTRTQVKLTDVATAVLALAAGVLAYLLLLSVVDHWVVGLSTAARWLSLGVLLLGAGYYFAVAVLPLILMSINPVFAAHTIEQGQPSLKNSLVNFLLLRDDPTHVHQVVREALGQRAAADLLDVPADTTVDRSRLIQIGYIAAGVMAVFAVYTILSPKDPFQTFARVVFPWAELARPARVAIADVKPGDLEMYHGRDLVVSAAVNGLGKEEEVTLFYSTADGQTDKRPVTMKLDKGGLRYEASLPPEPTGVQQDMVYHLVAGDAETPEYRITVLPAPSISIVKLHYDYPDYTGEPDLDAPREGDIRGLEGTRVTIYAEANQEIQSAFIEFDPHGGAGKTAAAPVALTIDPQNVKQARATITLQMVERTIEGVTRKVPKYSSYQLRFTNGKGDKNEHPLQYAIEVTPDLPPEVEILSPTQREIEVPLTGGQPIDVRALDPDFKLTRVVIRGAISNTPRVEATLLDDPTGVRGQASLPTFQFEPKKLGLAVGDNVAVWAEASDNRASPIDRRPEPNVSRTPRYLFKIVAPKTGEPTPADMPPPSDPMMKPGDPMMPPQNQGMNPMNHMPPPQGNQNQGNQGNQGNNQGGQGQNQNPKPNGMGGIGDANPEGANNQGNPPNGAKPPKNPGSPKQNGNGNDMQPQPMQEKPDDKQPKQRPQDPKEEKQPKPADQRQQKNMGGGGASSGDGSAQQGSDGGGDAKQGKTPSGGQPQGQGNDQKQSPMNQKGNDREQGNRGGNQQQGGNTQGSSGQQQGGGTEQDGNREDASPSGGQGATQRGGSQGGGQKPEQPLNNDGRDDGAIVDKVTEFLKEKAKEEAQRKNGAGGAQQPMPPPMPSELPTDPKERQRLQDLARRAEEKLTEQEKKDLQDYADRLKKLEEKHQQEQNAAGGQKPEKQPGNQGGQPQAGGQQGSKAGNQGNQQPMQGGNDASGNMNPTGNQQGGNMPMGNQGNQQGGNQPMPGGNQNQGNQGNQPMPGGNQPMPGGNQQGNNRGMQPGDMRQDMNPGAAGGNQNPQPAPMGGQPKPGDTPGAQAGGNMGDQQGMKLSPGGMKPMEMGGAAGNQMGPMKNQGGGDQGGMSEAGGNPEMQPMAGGNQKGPMGGMGQDGNQTQGQKSANQQGSPMSQGGMKQGQPMQGNMPMQGSGGGEAQSPGTDKKQSKTQGESGDKSGAGGQGGGQNGMQPGNDSSGGSTPSDSGSGQAEGQGSGNQGNKGGDGRVAEQPTGHAGKQEGQGSTTKAGNDKQGPGQKGGQQAPRPGDQGGKGRSKPGEDPTQGDERGGTGGPGGRRGQNIPENQEPDGPPLPTVDAGEDANPEYAREVTQLTLDYLKNQVDKPDPELLKRLGAKPDDKDFLRKFVERWEKMYKDAAVPGNTEAKQELDDTLRSLGLRSQADRVRRGDGPKDDFRDQDAARSRPPTEYERLFRAFNRATQGLKK